MIEILLPALALSVILLGIHAWFGLQIIRRGIIFTDLAVGQMAALGAAAAIAFLDGGYVYPVSLAAALLAALLIAYGARSERIHLEAFIGLLYAVGFAGGYIVLSRVAHGMEEFNRVIAADILFTPWREIWIVAALYSVIGMALWFSRGWKDPRARDLAFFFLFAVTVTSSVRLAGALVVFSILIAPAFIVETLRLDRRLLWAWIIGAAVNAAAVTASYMFDAPTGYMIALVNGIAAIAAGLLAGRPFIPRGSA